MLKKNYGRLFAALMCVVLLTAFFGACGKSDDKDQTVQPDFSWIVEPNIEAQSIEPLVYADFNENTNHYDISYADCCRINKDGLWGIIDFDGNIVIECEYDEIFAIRSSDDFLAVKELTDGDKEQTYIHSDTFETQTAYKSYNKEKYEYYMLTRTSEPCFVLNKNGEFEEKNFSAVLPEPIVGAQLYNGEFTKDGTYGLYSGGSELTGMAYSGAGCFAGGLAAFKSNGKWGYLDSDGNTVVPFKYDAVKGYSVFGEEDTPYECFEGYITASMSGKFGVINESGDSVIDFAFEFATPVVGGKFFAKQNGKWGIVDIKTANSKAVPGNQNNLSQSAPEQSSSDGEEEYSVGSYRITVEAGGKINIRSGAGTNYSVVGSLGSEDYVYVDEVKNGWGHIVYGDSDGWFSLKYAKKAE
ncbi:MAG: WG repeat-containing protein [Clostridia bacterium]|nr:WG repeat-containing protein [Clostridia bacterium]